MTYLDVNNVGLGLMHFTWNPSKKFTQDEFNTILKGSIDASPKLPLFLNSGEFYGLPERHEAIAKLGQFFSAHPEYADKVIVSLKSGVNAHWLPDNSKENIAAGIEAIEKYLQPLFKARHKLPKKLDYYCLARIDDTHPLEDTIAYLDTYIQKGVIDKICLSEVSGPYLERGAKTGKVSAVEVEYSLWTQEPKKNGLLKVAKQFGIPVIAYSPLGHGVLGGLTPAAVQEEGDIRSKYDKFQDATWAHNKVFVEELSSIASANNISLAQLSLGWIVKTSDREYDGFAYPQIIPIPGSVKLERNQVNLHPPNLSEDAMARISKLLSSFTIEGGRSFKELEATLK